MNRKIPYDKILAQKMEHLPVPDMEVSWQKMRSILDAEMPPEGKKKPVAGKWWISGLAVLVISGAAIFYIQTANTPEPPATAEVVESTIIFPERMEPAAESLAGENTITGAANTVPLTHTGSGSGIATQQQPAVEEEKPATAAAANPSSFKRIADETLIPQKTNNVVIKNDQGKNITLRASGNAPVAQPIDQNTGTGKPPAPGSNTAVSNLDFPANKGEAIPDDKTSDLRYRPATASIRTTPASVPVENLSYTDKRSVSSFHTRPGRLVYDVPESETARKTAEKQLKRQQRRDEKDMARSYKTSRSLWGEQPDRWFAAGIAPFQNVSIGDQKTYNYGAGATRNMATDYIPSPYLQLHVTNRVYVQSEFQFNSPQSTPSLLLDHRSMVTPTTTAMEEHTFLRKMYYFHMPVSFYYSPVKNFYLGSGLQFSSLSSALATVEQTGPNNAPMRSETITLKDDALSGKLRGSEWRYLLDANYYINRFSFGVRYSQALNNYIDRKAVSNLPDIQARNQTFQLYMRYNIIVSDKRR